MHLTINIGSNSDAKVPTIAITYYNYYGFINIKIFTKANSGISFHNNSELFPQKCEKGFPFTMDFGQIPNFSGFFSKSR